MRLTEGFHKKGYKIMMDNFFSSVKTAGLLKGKYTTVVRTVHANFKRIPKELKKGNNEKFSSKFVHNNDKKCLLVNYQSKEEKNVNLISIMHNSPATDSTEKKKPLVIHFYNHKKLVWMFLIKWPIHNTCIN